MSTALTKTQQNRNALSTTLEQERDYVVTVISPDKVEEFKANYLELANNQYLIDKIPAKEILTTAVNATALGVNVNPIYKEAYILPFNVTGKGMVASIVIPKHGHVQMAFQAGFFLQIENVWSINGSTKAENEMNREELMLLKTTDINFVKEHLIGWEFILEDISKEEIKVPTQHKFVGLEYAMKATKQLQMPEFAIQTWIHKATRRAMDEMFIPRHRKSLMIEKIEEWNNNHMQVGNISTTSAPIDPLEPKQSETFQEAEIIDTPSETVNHTVAEINKMYTGGTPDEQSRMGDIFAKYGKDWRTNQESINRIYKDIKDMYAMADKENIG